MKSIMISIKPKWVEKIANGSKTIEVRKTRPKIETPFKCYIYETQGASRPLTYEYENGRFIYEGRCAVIGEFVCDRIDTYYADDFVGAEDLDGSIITEPKEGVFGYWIVEREKTCLSWEDINNYGNGKTLYGWHISDLKIYDEPKELSEFCRGCNDSDDIMYGSYCPYCDKRNKLTKSFPSWGYVEVEE